MNRRKLFGLIAALPLSIFAPKVATKTYAGLDVSGPKPVFMEWPPFPRDPARIKEWADYRCTLKRIYVNGRKVWVKV